MNKGNTVHRSSRFSIRTVGLLALAAALVLSACSSGPATDDSADASDTTAGSELSGELSVYAAASLQAAFETLTTEFSAQHPDVRFAPVVYDGSSTIATQLIAGAPADIFASADEPNMDTVVDEGLIEGNPELFATNSLVIAVAPGNPLGIESLASLIEPVDGEDPIVVLCASEVPCGNASRDLLETAGVELTPASEEQNVSAVLAKVQAGEADAGLVYRTDVMTAEGSVDEVEIEGSDQRPNRYPIGVLTASADAEAAQAFSEFVRSEQGLQILEEFGFGAP